MAKRTVDPCIFCAALPCECDGPVKVKGKRLPSVPTMNAKTVELPVEDVTSKSATSRVERMRAKALEDAARMPAPVVGVPLSPQPRSRATRQHEEPEKFDADKVNARIAATLDEDTCVLNAAIRALAPLLSPEDQKVHAVILSTEPSLDEQKLVWKARHRDLQANSS